MTDTTRSISELAERWIVELPQILLGFRFTKVQVEVEVIDSLFAIRICDSHLAETCIILQSHLFSSLTPS